MSTLIAPYVISPTFLKPKNLVHPFIFEDTDGDFPKSSISATPAEFAHTVTEVVINHDGDGDDSGFQSHCVEKTFDPRTPVNSHLRRESDDGTPSSIGSSEKSVVSSGAQRVVSDITSHSRPVTFTPSRVKRRSLFTLRSSNSSPPPPPPTIADRSHQKPLSMRMSTSISQEHSSNSCRRVKDGNHLVAHTVAERRARAEALEVERRRARRAILEASEAALEAARQRAHSLRAARSLELRNREEERHARVVARRKLLEEERKEYLIRRITSTATITETGDHSHRLRSLRNPKPKVSVCGFASELDPSDPRYCPFGFGSCTRRDVCPSPMQQLAVIRKTESCSGRGGFRHAAISKLSTSFTVESQGRLMTNADAKFASTQSGSNKPPKDRNINSTPSKRRQSGSAIPKSSTNSNRSFATAPKSSNSELFAIPLTPLSTALILCVIGIPFLSYPNEVNDKQIYYSNNPLSPKVKT
ncbi:unnamed protein product [Taenia asiatica]|uniref:Uncharacterized protein n=1 Tax=Taenia asiatica TaxID=60517 RepID=A0A3P6PWA1_TAEAS|nr:unnamed protein product [Taenia asiatica]